MLENTKQPSVNGGLSSENPGEVNPDDVLDRGFREGYPKMATPRALAKEYDPAFLHNCSAERLRNIAKGYKNVVIRSPKVELFQALFDAMLEEQECPVCEVNCDPRTHVFLPFKDPPHGLGHWAHWLLWSSYCLQWWGLVVYNHCHAAARHDAKSIFAEWRKSPLTKFLARSPGGPG